MSRIRSFPPVADERATLLILGSMPGKESLRQQQYYAHPHNTFWKIMGELAGAHPALPYPARLQCLKDRGIALWDVLHSCEREGSLDSNIEQEAPNDFAAFFAQHPHITRICFNGAKAEQSFRKFVPGKQQLPPLNLVRLPSTSPAHAGMRYEEKLAAWKKSLTGG
ncbi:MAG TPA: DNA-deoxyinosine glycosylase [Sideroxyarcus sp.]|nr:DNA-deoxyinosine glycosylase [Sideroxyarcus sp.]